MTVNALERACFDLSTDRAARKSYKEDPDALLGRYALDVGEVVLVKELDVRELLAVGVNPMLVWGMWSMYGGGDQAAYLSRVSGNEAAQP